jgi:hypothetical protein
MPSSRIVLLVPLCAIGLSGRAEADPAPATSRVVVRVYETAGLDPDARTAALLAAESALASASLAVSWKQCGTAADAHACDRPLSDELVVRLLRRPAAILDEPVRLGDALVDQGARSAVLATVYVDRVAQVANAAGLRSGTLLGYAIAHELGHLLLASNTHSRNGLMRPVWRDEELRSGRDADWAFTRENAAAIRARLGVDFISDRC